jgi:hypothetical protein
MATFTCGANEHNTPDYDGRTIADARNGLRTALNISDDMRVLLNDNETANVQTVIRADDTVEFLKQGGTKGN